MTEYKSRQQVWERKSSIRSRPRRVLDVSNAEVQYFYPPNRQALCLHPEIKKLGKAAIRYILTQSAYKFMGDIASVETMVVCQLATKIANKLTPYQFPYALQQDMLSIVIDETYHAYVANDFIQQVVNKVGINPIMDNYETGLYAAIQTTKAQLPLELHDGFEIAAVSIGENSITKSLISVNKEDAVNSTFSEVNADHMVDEGRHSGIFLDMLKLYWEQESESNKVQIGAILPTFIREYLKPDKQKSYDTQILQKLGLNILLIEQIIDDTYIEYTLENFKEVNPIVKQITTFLERAGILFHQPTHESFRRQCLID